MKAAIDWMKRIRQILAYIDRERISYAEITLTVKGGKVVFIDYRGALHTEDEDPEE